MKNRIIEILRQSIFESATMNNQYVELHLDDLHYAMQYAADEILDAIALHAHKQWDGELTLAHVPQ